MVVKSRVIWLTLSTGLGKGTGGVVFGGERMVFASNLNDCKGYLRRCHFLGYLDNIVHHVAYSR